MQFKILLILSFIASSVALSTRSSYAVENSSQAPYLGQFDVGYKYYSLEVDQITDAYTETSGVQLVTIDWSMPGRWGRFLPKASYEFSPGASAAQDELVERSNSADSGWQKFAADLSYQLSDQLTLALRYEKELYLYSVEASRDYYFVSNSGTELLVSGDNLNTFNEFNDFSVVGFDEIKISNSMSLAWELGYFSIDYRKPFTSDIFTGLETIYDAQFSASGMQIGAGVLMNDAQQIYLRLRGVATDAEVELPGGFQLSGVSGTGGYTGGNASTLNYEEIIINYEYDFSHYFNQALIFKAEYSVRTFDGYVANVNDDKFFNLSLRYRFSI